MKTIQFKGKKYTIPTSWEDITLRQQIAVSEISTEQKYVKTLGVIAGYTGIPVEDLKTAEMHKVENVMKHLTFISEKIDDTPIKEFQFKGDKYIINPNILKQQWQDFVSITVALSDAGDNKWNAVPYILAVMAKKKGETLDDYDIRERAELFQDIDVVTANKINAFFLSSTRGLQYILTLSSPEAQHEILRGRVDALSNSLTKLKESRGGNLLIRLHCMIIQRLIKYLNRQLEKYYSSPQSKPLKKKWKAILMRLQWKMPKQKNK